MYVDVTWGKQNWGKQKETQIGVKKFLEPRILENSRLVQAAIWVRGHALFRYSQIIDLKTTSNISCNPATILDHTPWIITCQINEAKSALDLSAELPSDAKLAKYLVSDRCSAGHGKVTLFSPIFTWSTECNHKYEAALMAVLFTNSLQLAIWFVNQGHLEKLRLWVDPWTDCPFKCVPFGCRLPVYRLRPRDSPLSSQ